MGARFIGRDRDPVFLDAAVAAGLGARGPLRVDGADAVEELQLSAFYADYRADGHGRPAYEPAMMVALCTRMRAEIAPRGGSSGPASRTSPAALWRDLAPDHSTIAEFRCRHEAGAGRAVFGRAWAVRAGGAGVGRGGGDRRDEDGGNASSDANRAFGRIAREILAEAAELTAARTTSTAPSAATSCPSIYGRGRAGARRCARPRSAWSASAISRPRRADDDEG